MGRPAKKTSVVRVEADRFYKDVTSKTAPAGLKSAFLCILQLNRAVKSEIIRLK